MLKSGLIGFGASVALASMAAADVTLDLGSHTLTGNQLANAGSHLLVGHVTGFTITFDYVSNTAGSWASDMVLLIAPPGVAGTAWGGFNTQFDAPNNGGLWGFDGAGSAASGTYTDTKTWDSTAGGIWEFGIGNGWTTSPAVSYNNVVLTLHGSIVPAPGAFALLGLAGLAGSRRRRG